MKPELITFEDEKTSTKVYQLRVPYCYIEDQKTLKYWKFKITAWMLKLMWFGK